jgi:drug/metabolite transporter (DMT)-like permease
VPWVLLALIAALSTATRDAAAKHATAATDAITVAFGIAVVPAAALGTVAVLLGLPDLDDSFVTALFVSGTINTLATPLIVWALERSDLSLVAPLTSLTPLFMIGTAGVVLGELPTLVGGLGVAVIVVGAYLLNVSRRRVSPLEPFRALLRDPGARAMLLVAFLYSISATYDKVGVQASSPMVWAASIQAFVALLLGPIAAWRWRAGHSRPGSTGSGESASDAGRAGAGRTQGAPGTLARFSLSPVGTIGLAGAVLSIGLVAQNIALTLTLAAYVIAVKRTSTLFGVLLGHSLFREERVPERLLGAAVMLAGFVLVTLA